MAERLEEPPGVTTSTTLISPNANASPRIIIQIQLQDCVFSLFMIIPKHANKHGINNIHCKVCQPLLWKEMEVGSFFLHADPSAR